VLTFGNWEHEESLQSGSAAASYITTRNEHQEYEYDPLTCLPDSYQTCLELHPLAEPHFFQPHLTLHPPQLHVTLLPYAPVILLNFVLYLPLYTSVYIPQLHFIQYGTYGQPGEESLFTEESRSPP
jgi:hypothetical protein